MIRVLLVDEGGRLTDETVRHRLPGSSLVQETFEVTTNSDLPADVVIVFNSLKFDRRLTGRTGFFFKWDYEPILSDQTAHSFDKVYSFRQYPNKNVEIAPPILDWWLDKSFDELVDLPVPEKPHALSAIASTKEMIEGHRIRNKFIESALTASPSIHLFGHGRERELDNKWDGVAGYKYSIAIENSNIDNYWTEKISDCLLAYTVPVYFGAPNIYDFFPRESIVWLPVTDSDNALEVIRSVISSDNWSLRLDAVKQARTLILQKYSLFAQISRIVDEYGESILSAPLETRLIRGRRTRPGGWEHGKGIVFNIHRQITRRFS